MVKDIPVSHHVARHAAAKAAKLAKDAIQELPPLQERCNVFLATAIAFAFGPLGVAIYFRSFKDFFLCLAILLWLSFLMLFDPGKLFGWLFSPAYAAFRAHTSNAKLASSSNCALVE